MILLNVELMDGTQCETCKKEFKRGESVEAYSEDSYVRWDHIKCP